MYKIIKSLRSLETEITYQNFLKKPKKTDCFLCRANSIRDFEHWKIVENEYPYDGVAVISHVLTTKKHKVEKNFTKEEREELVEIKRELGNQYDMIIENGWQNQSIPEHYHLHLLILKQRKVEIPSPQDAGFFNAKNEA